MGARVPIAAENQDSENQGVPLATWERILGYARTPRQFGVWLIVAGGFVAFYALIYGPVSHFAQGGLDWRLFWRSGALGDTSALNGPYWSLFISWLPAQLPEPFGYAAWLAAGVTVALLTARFFGSPLLLVLLSYQLNWVLYYGQVEPFLAAGVGLGALALRRRNPWLAGLAIALLTLKPQVGALVALYVFWSSSSRLRTAAAFGAVVAASMVAWPGWPAAYLTDKILPFFQRNAVEIAYFSAAVPMPLWASAALALLALWLPLGPRRKMQALVAATLLASPYSPIYSQMTLLCLGLPLPFYIFALAPWAVAIALGPFSHWQWAALFPLAVLAYCCLSAVPPPWWARLRGWGRAPAEAPTAD